MILINGFGGGLWLGSLLLVAPFYALTFVAMVLLSGAILLVYTLDDTDPVDESELVNKEVGDRSRYPPPPPPVPKDY